MATRDVASATGMMGGAKPKKSPKVIDHIRIHPKMGGGAIVAHHYTSMEHEPKQHEFGMTDGSGFHEHLATVTGMPMSNSGETEVTNPAGEEE